MSVDASAPLQSPRLPSASTDPRTRALLEAPILPLLLRMAWPNTLIMLAQASSGLIETWWISRLGVDALSGMALVFPGVMMMQMISAGAMGGGISAAVARALGGQRREEADALVWHAVLINGLLGLAFSAVALIWGRPLYSALGGHGASLEAALAYSNVVYAGNALLWIMNALASVVRGTGNMLVPGLVICGGTALLVPLSPCLIFGWGPFPALGVAGGGTALVVFYTLGLVILAWYVLSGRNLARWRPTRLRWPLFRSILAVGGVGAISSLQTTLTVGFATAMVAGTAGTKAVAGFGTGARLEYLLIPIVFGVGAPLVAMIGTNIGAARKERTLRIALSGSLICFGLTETIGLAVTIWPRAWLELFGQDPEMLAAGAAYLHTVGPFYGFFGLGLSLYFASQGAGRLFWPLTAGLLRIVVAIGGGWLALSLSGSIFGLFIALGMGLVCYGTLMAYAVWRGAWFTAPRTLRRTPPAPTH